MKAGATERFRTILAVIIIAGVLYLFYHSFWALLLLPAGIVIYRRIRRKDLKRQHSDLLALEFLDMLESLIASLRVGYSMENALKECLQEMILMHGEDAPICRELRLMLSSFRLGFTAEQAFQEFAARSAVEDIETFAAVYSIAKKAGGDMVEILTRTSNNLSGRVETRSEIAVLISSKKLEQNIMTLIPVGIILYMEMTSQGLLDPLYGNLPGVLIMTACLSIYLAAMWLGRKIIRIEV